MADNEVNTEQKKSNFVFGLPLTDEDKQTIIDILRKEFVWESGNSSYQIKQSDTGTQCFNINRCNFRPSLSFEEKCEFERKICKRLCDLAEIGMVEAITAAFAVTWNRKDDFAVVRKIVRKYTDNEHDYYKERSKDLKPVFSLADVLKSRIGYLNRLPYKNSYTRRVQIIIQGEKYIIRNGRLRELKEAIKDKKELVRELKKEAVPVIEHEE